MMMKHGCGAHMGGHGARHAGGHHGDGSEEPEQPDLPSRKAVDPVCGMEIDADHAHAMIRRGDQRLFFCSEKCLSKFEAAPENYPSS